MSGRLSPRRAVSECESDQECAGFTYMGTAEEGEEERAVAFFR